jgi:hypothetical protein
MTIFEMAGSCARRMAKSLFFVPLLLTSAVAIADNGVLRGFAPFMPKASWWKVPSKARPTVPA